jgi:hypothetical protein
VTITWEVALDVSEDPPSISYAPGLHYLAFGDPMLNFDPISVGGPITSYELTMGTLPDGVAFSTSTGRFSGTPNEVTAVLLGVTAHGDGGDSVEAEIEFDIGVKPRIDYDDPFEVMEDEDVDLDHIRPDLAELIGEPGRAEQDVHRLGRMIAVACPEIGGVRLTQAARAQGLALAPPERVEMARPTGFERADARNIRIPVEGARALLFGEIA